jgi:glucose/arabinose dehydrogenase
MTIRFLRSSKNLQLGQPLPFFVVMTVAVGLTGCQESDLPTQSARDEPVSGPALAVVPGNFSDVELVGGIMEPTLMAIAPDGRIFVSEQAGKLRVIKNGALLTAPFVTLNVNRSGERGLLGIAFDPAFATNRFVYVYYTSSTGPHNRVSRFTASGDVAAGGETVLLDLPTLVAQNHNGGAIHFGPDGKLYIAVGDNAKGANAQSLSTPLGKLLRINPDGTIPSDNPFVGSTTGINRSIWALGLRNPFTFAFQPGTGRLFINDVGQSAWEEINEGVAGANYGWPTTEGNPATRRSAHRFMPTITRTGVPSRAATFTTRRPPTSPRVTPATTSLPITAAVGSGASTSRPRWCRRWPQALRARPTCKSDRMAPSTTSLEGRVRSGRSRT